MWDDGGPHLIPSGRGLDSTALGNKQVAVKFTEIIKVRQHGLAGSSLAG